jgi:hypothetical protein
VKSSLRVEIQGRMPLGFDAGRMAGLNLAVDGEISGRFE